MATNGTSNNDATTHSQGAGARAGWSIGTRATIALAAVTAVLLLLKLAVSTPAWLVWVAGGLTLVAFIVALVRRAQRSAELERELF